MSRRSRRCCCCQHLYFIGNISRARLESSLPAEWRTRVEFDAYRSPTGGVGFSDYDLFRKWVVGVSHSSANVNSFYRRPQDSVDVGTSGNGCILVGTLSDSLNLVTAVDPKNGRIFWKDVIVSTRFERIGVLGYDGTLTTLLSYDNGSGLFASTATCGPAYAVPQDYLFYGKFDINLLVSSIGRMNGDGSNNAVVYNATSNTRIVGLRVATNQAKIIFTETSSLSSTGVFSLRTASLNGSNATTIATITTVSPFIPAFGWSNKLQKIYVMRVYNAAGTQWAFSSLNVDGSQNTDHFVATNKDSWPLFGGNSTSLWPGCGLEWTAEDARANGIA